MTRNHDGVLIVRDTGVVRVDDAVPWSAQQQAELDALCAMLGAGPKQHPAPGSQPATPPANT